MFKKTFLFSITLFLSSAIHAEALKLHTSQLIPCGQKNVQVLTACEGRPSIFSCKRQQVIYQDPTGMVNVYNVPDPESGLIREMMCVAGKSAYYAVAALSNGGNCRQCEWHEMFSLDGRRITSGHDRNYKQTMRSLINVNAPEPKHVDVLWGTQAASEPAERRADVVDAPHGAPAAASDPFEMARRLGYRIPSSDEIDVPVTATGAGKPDWYRFRIVMARYVLARKSLKVDVMIPPGRANEAVWDHYNVPGILSKSIIGDNTYYNEIQQRMPDFWADHPGWVRFVFHP